MMRCYFCGYVNSCTFCILELRVRDSFVSLRDTHGSDSLLLQQAVYPVQYVRLQILMGYHLVMFLGELPSCTRPLIIRVFSSQCATTAIFNFAARFIASSIILASCTPTPSSVKANAPGSFNAFQSVSSYPTLSTVMDHVW